MEAFSLFVSLGLSAFACITNSFSIKI
jgi:hypothetical protein